MALQIPEMLFDCSRPDAFDFPLDVLNKQLGYPQLLSATDTFREALLLEIKRLSKWTGVYPHVYETDACDTSAHSSCIFFNITQMKNCFTDLMGDELECALFFTLAHEYAHLLLRQRLGDRFMGRILPFYEEASADIIAASWLALKLPRNDNIIPDYIGKTCLKLNSFSHDYPSPTQRRTVAEKGICLTYIIDQYCDPHLCDDDNYVPLFEKLSRRDVSSLVHIAYNTLQEIRDEELFEKAIAAGRSRTRNSTRNKN